MQTSSGSTLWADSRNTFGIQPGWLMMTEWWQESPLCNDIFSNTVWRDIWLNVRWRTCAVTSPRTITTPTRTTTTTSTNITININSSINLRRSRQQRSSHGTVFKAGRNLKTSSTREFEDMGDRREQLVQATIFDDEEKTGLLQKQRDYRSVRWTTDAPG